MPETPYLKFRREIKLGNKSATGKKLPKRIPMKSAKMKIDDPQYKRLVKEMLAESNVCELKTPVCTKIAQGLHHTKRRGALLLVKKYLKRSCNACNGWVERFPVEALKQGLSVSVHKIES